MRFLLMVSCLVLPLAAQVSTSPDPETAAVRATVQKYVDARDRADAKAIAALFTADADQLVSSGEWRRGNDQVVSGTVAASAREGKRSITVETVRFISSDVALADGRYEVGAVGGGEVRRMWTSLLMKRTPEGWRIAAIRNMMPAPPAGAPAAR